MWMTDVGNTTWVTTVSISLAGRNTMEFYTTAAKFYNVYQNYNKLDMQFSQTVLLFYVIVTQIEILLILTTQNNNFFLLFI